MSADADTDADAAHFTTPEVILFSADVERASAFYQRLGFVETFRASDDGTPIHVDLELDGYKIGFASVRSAREDHGLDPAIVGQRGTISLWTVDTAAAYRWLLDAGVTSLSPPAPWLGRLLIAWMQDPDGHAIQIVQQLIDAS